MPFRSSSMPTIVADNGLLTAHGEARARATNPGVGPQVGGIAGDDVGTEGDSKTGYIFGFVGLAFAGALGLGMLLKGAAS